MTLILSCATSDFVYQVSDRRVTVLSDVGRGTVMDDESNKAVVVHQRMAFGYTGISKIDGKPTDIWLAHVAAEQVSHDLRVVCDHIAGHATKAFASVPARFARHAFIGVGWAGRSDRPGLHPTLCTISNAVDATGEWKPSADKQFSVQVGNWGRIGAGFGIAATGATLPQNEKYAIWRLIRRCVKHHAQPDGLFRALVIAMEFAASRYSSIGQNLMALCIPRVTAEAYLTHGLSTFLSGTPLATQNTFLYLKPGGSPIAYGPHFAGRGLAITGFESGPIA